MVEVCVAISDGSHIGMLLKKGEDEKSKQSTMKYVEELTERGVVDPAFAFALKQVGDLPR